MTPLISVQGNSMRTGQKPSVSEFSFNLHTIIMVLGPEGSGESEFICDNLIPSLRKFETGEKTISIVLASLKNSYQELVDYNENIFLEKKIYPQITDEAENLLFCKVKNATSYPVNADFVIVNGNSMNSEFRNKILLIADENHYKLSLIIFNYNNKSDYYSVIDKSPTHPGKLKELRRVLSGDLSSAKFYSLFTIKERNFNNYNIVIDDYSDYEQFILPSDLEYVLIGDLHVCLDELKELLKLNGFLIDKDEKITHIENKRIVLLGDLIDKKSGVSEVIKFIHKNIDVFYMILGNHEAFVYRSLKKIISVKDISLEVRKEFFETYDFLKDYVAPSDKEILRDYIYNDIESGYYHYYGLTNEEIIERYFEACPPPTNEQNEERIKLRQQFFEIVEAMKSFFVHENFIVTHAPCEKRFLGKIDNAALKAARDFRYPKQRDFEDFNQFIYAFDEHVSFLKGEASEKHPLHIFGHVMTKEVAIYKNKICIDTGCVSGGKLTSVTIKKGKITDFKSVEIIDKTKIKEKKLFNLFN